MCVFETPELKKPKQFSCSMCVAVRKSDCIALYCLIFSFFNLCLLMGYFGFLKLTFLTINQC